MTGLEKIIKEIQDEAANEAAEVIAKAKAEAEEILAAARASADAKTTRVSEGASQDVADIGNAQQSAKVLQRRQRTLSTKQQVLSETLAKALESLYVLNDADYFALLTRLAVNTAQPGEGEMMLNEKDKTRLPASFEQEMNAALPEGQKLVVSNKNRPIDGGFVLGYGGVEENCSFEAMFNARREEFSDLVRDILFA